MNDYYQGRLESLRKELAKIPLSSLLVTDSCNVTWLTGFTGDSSYALVTLDRVVIISDTRFTVQLSEECPGLPVEIRGSGKSTLKLATEVALSFGLNKLGVEEESISLAMAGQLISELKTCQLVSTRGLIEGLRSIKDDVEIQKIRNSVAVNEAAYRTVIERLHSEMTEREIAFALENEMRLRGADRCAFTPIVGVGARAALPHARLTHQRLSASPFVLIDWGTSLEGYASDLTRTIVTGDPPAKFVEIYAIVLEAQKRAISMIRPGESLRKVDAAARHTIADAGFGDYFGHGLGHGFGLQVHEQPSLSPNRDGTFAAGMVVTVEPGIYLPGIAGVRIEDDVLVTPDGHEIISSLPREFEAQHVLLMK